MTAAPPQNRIRELLDDGADPVALARGRAEAFDSAVAAAIQTLRELLRDPNARYRLAACETLIRLKAAGLRHNRELYADAVESTLDPLPKPGTLPTYEEENADDEPCAVAGSPREG